MTQDVISCSAVAPPSALNITHVESFLARQQALGYATCKFRDKCRIIQYFVRWTQMMELPATEIAETHVAAHFKAFEHLSQERFAFKRALLSAFVRHLRYEGVTANMEESVEQSSARQLEQDYADYLRDERGLSFRSLLVYLPPVRAFLTDCMAKPRGVSLCDFNAEMVRAFLLSRVSFP